MPDQQGKKTQPSKMPNTGGGASTGGPGASSTPPSIGQDKTQTQGMKSQPSGSSSTSGQTKSQTGQPTSGMSSAGTTSSGQGSMSSDRPIGEKLSSTTNDILDKAKETASGTYSAVSSKATEKIEEQKGELSTGLKSLADTFRKTGSELESAQQTTPLTDVAARYTGTAARQIENIANYFERKDLKAMMRDAEDFARRNPAIFLGAAFGLGMLAARFLKSSPPDRRTSATGINTELPTALPSGQRPSTGVRTNP